jgi:hypothetical protein
MEHATDLATPPRSEAIGADDPCDTELTGEVEQFVAGLTRLHRTMVAFEQQALVQDDIDLAHFYSVVADHLLTAKEAATEALRLLRGCE